MINRNALKGKIVENGMTQEAVAKAIGMSPATFNRRMRDGAFGTDEAEKMIDILNIDNPSYIFFNQEVSSEVTN